MSSEPKPQVEQTEVGAQTLIDGVRPVTLGEKLTARTCHPMTPKRNPNAQQRPCDLGLFDEVGRAQIDLFDFIKTNPSTPTANKETTP